MMATKTETDSLKVKKNHKEEAVSFLRLTSEGKVNDAFESYVAPKFRHHNAFFPGDAKSLAAAMERDAAANPDRTIEVEHTLEDGDLIAVHSRVRMAEDGPEMGLVHIFRFEGDKIAELWDIGQPVPDDSPNQYGMF
jgi:predicted SnoaL-like aldol condensation-catalyzing enzyme